MGTQQVSLMKKFKEKYHKSDDAVTLYTRAHQKIPCLDDYIHDIEYMEITEPAILATFVAYCQQRESRGIPARQYKKLPALRSISLSPPLRPRM